MLVGPILHPLAKKPHTMDGMLFTHHVSQLAVLVLEASDSTSMDNGIPDSAHVHIPSPLLHRSLLGK
eukprot:12702822-Alexandrium_andersonii.AAC.1